MQAIRIGIVGLGTVGMGVAKILLGEPDRLARHAGAPLELAAVVVRDAKKPRDASIPAGLCSTDLARITGDPRITLAAHLVGGLEPARTILLRLLESGKDVVTANKLLLAEHGPELFARARQLGRAIAFDAAVAGGIPIVTNIGQCLAANRITALCGILNGTSNFIITHMEESGTDYASVLAEAQRRGYAETDPSLDVNGSDAAQKLKLLAHLAFGVQVKWSEIPRVGIDRLAKVDMQYARELGYRIKLLAAARLSDGGLELNVSPTLVRIGRPLAEVRDSFNAISVTGSAVGEVFFSGRGAGQMPTASAVAADLLDLASGRGQITFRNLALWSDSGAGVAMCPAAKCVSRYYLRLTVDDHPGVLADVAGALGRNHISIASVIQHEPTERGDKITLPLIIMTHSASEAAAEDALAEIARLGCVHEDCVRMRVMD